ncbi:hypothetical protein N7494_006933 [Penicillium frequentans]|uniref:NmrA-like domain-containing protein n=1 Tax=Penicillium frequentans TaxID=3151616 RepID=A0AAD6CXD7_9EURO|nr:hypothetical protein N7494_006933 [Penicillium glabrum]
MTVKKMLIVGAAGETGSSIANGLLESTTKFRTKALLLEKRGSVVQIEAQGIQDIFALARLTVHEEIRTPAFKKNMS